MAFTVLVSVLVFGSLAYLLLFTGRRAKNLPPGEFVQGMLKKGALPTTSTGPKTLPVIGNLHLFPKERVYLKWVLRP